MDQDSQIAGKWYQQGDVTIKPIDRIPKNASDTGTHVLAEGEATGHKHLAQAHDVQLFLHRGKLYMRAPNGTTIVHEEHSPIEIPAGEYEIGRVREYDHFGEKARPVID